MCCKSKTGRHNQDRSRRATIHRRILTRPVFIVATGLGFATRPGRSQKIKSLSEIGYSEREVVEMFCARHIIFLC